MNDAFDSIERILTFCAQAQQSAVEPELIRWMAARWTDYVSNAEHGVTADQAFHLKPARGCAPWWVVQARRKRDAAIRNLARPFAMESITKQAQRVLSIAHRYGDCRWQRDPVAT